MIKPAQEEVAKRKDSRENCLALPLVAGLKDAGNIAAAFHAANAHKQKRISAALHAAQRLVDARKLEGVTLLNLPDAIKEQITSEAHRSAFIALYRALGRPELFAKKPAGGKPDDSIPELFSAPPIRSSLSRVQQREGKPFMRRARSALRSFAAFLAQHPRHKTHRADLIRVDGVDAFLDSLTDATAYHYRSLLRRVFEQLREDGLMAHNPVLAQRDKQEIKDAPIRHILWLCQNSGEMFEEKLRLHIAQYLTRDDPQDGPIVKASAINGFATWLITKKIENLNYVTLHHLLEYRLDFLPGCKGLAPATQDDYFSQVTRLLHDLPFMDHPAAPFRSGKSIVSIALETGYPVRPELLPAKAKPLKEKPGRNGPGHP